MGPTQPVAPAQPLPATPTAPATGDPATSPATTNSALPSYEDLLDHGRGLFPGTRIGRPGRSRSYWLMIASMRLLRLKLDVDFEGRERIGEGPAILVGNHTSYWDPVVVVMSAWWRVVAFTKVEAFEGKGSVFFRIMGQIPLRRGDEERTHWAMEMSRRVLLDGNKIGIYPEGTRSPEPDKLHRLHKRVLVPLLQENPDIPVHAVTATYAKGRAGRTRVLIRASEPLPLTPEMSGQELVDTVRDALLRTGNLGYVDVHARDAKAGRTGAGAGAAAHEQQEQ